MSGPHPLTLKLTSLLNVIKQQLPATTHQYIYMCIYMRSLLFFFLRTDSELVTCTWLGPYIHQGAPKKLGWVALFISYIFKDSINTFFGYNFKKLNNVEFYVVISGEQIAHFGTPTPNIVIYKIMNLVVLLELKDKPKGSSNPAWL